MNQHGQRLLSAAAALALFGLGACGKAPEPAAVNPPVSSATANVSDIDVTEHVKTVLSQTESLKGLDITVVTLKGDVRLTGVLDTQAQIDEALGIARAAEGVHTIHDELTLKK
jgi:hyperosmotically inducible periplasmic protein